MNIEEKLMQILKEYRGGDIDAKRETTFDALGFDSLDRMELLMKIEEEFGIVFDDDFQIETVGELIDKINKLRQ